MNQLCQCCQRRIIAQCWQVHSREEQEAVANEVVQGTPFGVLGIPRNATNEQAQASLSPRLLPPLIVLGQVKKAYRQLGRKWHPDKNRGNEEEVHACLVVAPLLNSSPAVL